jgi:hypothetical protein
MALPVLSTTKYTPIGVYIGQIIRPRPGNAATDARYPCIVGKGNRLAYGKNLGIYRAFVNAEVLTFPTTSPFLAVLTYQANGSKESPVRLYKGDGTLIRNDQWMFVTHNALTNKAIVINTEVYDSTATYYFDYQSIDRTVLDPVPVDELREIQAVGNTEDQPQYTEYSDFFIKTSVTDPVADTGNAHITRTLEAPVRISGTSTGTIVQDSSSTYLHNYNRYYTIKCLSQGGTTPNRTATFEWKAQPISAGNSCLPPVPLHSTGTAPTVIIDEATPSSLVQTLEQGIALSFAFGATHFQVNDEFAFNALGAGLIEKDDRYNNTNQYTDSSDITITGTGTGTLTAIDVNSYTSNYNSNFKLACTAAGGTLGSYTATFIWAQYGDTQPFASGTFSIAEATPSTLTKTLALGVSVTLSCGASNFVVSDTLSFKVLAPMIHYQGKDNRTTTLTVGSVVTASLTATVAGSFTTDTVEGSFGTFTSTATYGSATNDGKFVLNDNQVIAVRNVFKQSVGGDSRIDTSDIFTFAATNDGYIDWSLTNSAIDSRLTSEVYNDITGTVTGTANTWYAILTNIPVYGTVEVTDSLGAVTHTELTGTPYITFLSQPTRTLTISYNYKGQEPDPGQLYFLTANYLRPDNLYDTPTLCLSRDEGRTLLAPSTTDNHLYIANEIAWNNNVSGVWVVQVKDTDGDGIYNNEDYKRAILATEETTTISDRIVLSNWSSISTELAVNVKANDPFEKRESIDWFGCPINTPIGDDTTASTIRYYARNTLQVYGNSPAHGTRVIHGATWCKCTVELSTGVTQQVTLDGSFVSVGLASLVSSFTDNAETILRKTLSGFDSIQTYSESENVLLGSSNVIFFSDEGSSVYRIMEDVTVDTLAPEYELISATVQRHDTVKYIRTSLNAIIGTVVITGQAGVQLVRSQLAGVLVGLLGRGRIAPYQDDQGNERKFDPNTDVLVYQDSTNKTLYHFLYAIYLRYPIKRLYGLYSCDSNNFNS